MVSHKNVCALINSVADRIDILNKDIYLSYLPMAHTMERSIFNTIIYYEAWIGLYSGDTRKIVDDL